MENRTLVQSKYFLLLLRLKSARCGGTPYTARRTQEECWNLVHPSNVIGPKILAPRDQRWTIYKDHGVSHPQILRINTGKQKQETMKLSKVRTPGNQLINQSIGFLLVDY